MGWITSDEAARRMGTTPRRVQQMCKNGEIEGVRREGRRWLIPEEGISTAEKKKKPLPIGISDYKQATQVYYVVDKTLLIRDFLDNRPQVLLFTRPRRFGKTLNMDMLRVFFEKSDEDTSVYFKDKQIWRCGSEYTQYQGNYPVIFLTFKDVKCSTWAETKEQIGRLITLECLRHAELEHSPKLSKYEKEQYAMLAEGRAEELEYRMALQMLSQMLHKHHGVPVIMIIDEYDTPIQQGYVCGFYEETIRFMRNFFSGGLKDNPHLAYGFLTGILRIARESIFSGMNNVKIDTVLDEAYSRYFGFTKEEIQELLTYYEEPGRYDEICRWYDGYRFGRTEIFNPWSVISYIADGCVPKAYWQATGSNEIIGEIIASAGPEIMEKLHKLLNGERVATYVDTNVIYPEIGKDPYGVFSFLLVAGYLKVAASYPQFDGNYMCEVAIPNREIAFVYEKEVLEQKGYSRESISIRQAIFSGDVEMLRQKLEEFMLRSVSYMDGANEGFYHGMMLGLCAVLSDHYAVRSNREAGIGRLDIMLIPLHAGIPGFIFELKHTRSETDDLNELAEKALRQIDEKQYEAELTERGIPNTIRIGMAFCGKTAAVKRMPE